MLRQCTASGVLTFSEVPCPGFQHPLTASQRFFFSLLCTTAQHFAHCLSLLVKLNGKTSKLSKFHYFSPLFNSLHSYFPSSPCHGGTAPVSHGLISTEYTPASDMSFQISCISSSKLCMDVPAQKPAVLHLVLVHHHAEPHMMLTFSSTICPSQLGPVACQTIATSSQKSVLRGAPTSCRGSPLSKMCHAFSRCICLFKWYPSAKSSTQPRNSPSFSQPCENLSLQQTSNWLISARPQIPVLSIS